MHQYAPGNTKSQRGLNSNDYNIPAEAGIKIIINRMRTFLPGIRFWLKGRIMKNVALTLNWERISICSKQYPFKKHNNILIVVNNILIILFNDLGDTTIFKAILWKRSLEQIFTCQVISIFHLITFCFVEPSFILLCNRLNSNLFDFWYYLVHIGAYLKD